MMSLALVILIAQGLVVVTLCQTTAYEGLECLILGIRSTACAETRGRDFSDRLAQVYEGLPNSTLRKLNSGQISNLTSLEISELPLALVYLLPDESTRELSGTSLAVLLQNHVEDAALLAKVIVALDSESRRDQFMDKMIGEALPNEAQVRLGEEIFSWWQDWSFVHIEMSQRVGSPVLAYLPPAFVAALKEKLAVKFLYHLRAWQRSSFSQWGDNSRLTKRVWCKVAVEYLYKGWDKASLQGFEFILTGATSSEIMSLSPDQLNKDIFHLRLDKLQARSFFRLVYGTTGVLSMNELKEVLPITLQLTPRDVQRFDAAAVDFRLLQSVTPDMRVGSLATDIQIGWSLVAQAALSRAEPGIFNWGRYVYTLPYSTFKHVSKTLTRAHLLSMDSIKLSKRQALLLSDSGAALNLAKPATILGCRGLLAALRIRSLTRYHTGQVPQNVLTHLLAWLPSRSEPALLAALLDKVRPQIAEPSVMESLLINEVPHAALKLMSGRELGERSRELTEVLTRLKAEGFQEKIRLLPEHILSELYTSTNGSANCSSAVYLGVRCSDVVPILALQSLSCYNAQLRSVDKAFPKGRQYCWQRLVLRYASIKPRPDHLAYRNPLDLFSIPELNAVGGFVLASFPPDVISSAKARKDILILIGRLSSLQLSSAVTERRILSSYSQLLVNDLNAEWLGLDELTRLGSFLGVLSAAHVSSIDSEAFRLFLEGDDAVAWKTLCIDGAARKAWNALVNSAFGAVSGWNSSDLVHLGDMLVVLDQQELDSISTEAWLDAIDLLTEQTSYYKLQSCEMPGHRQAVEKLLLKYLAVNEMQLDSVLNATQILSKVRTLQKQDHSVRILPNLTIARDPKRIEILSPQESKHLPSSSFAAVRPSTNEVPKSSAGVSASSTGVPSSSAKVPSSTEVMSSSTEVPSSSTEVPSSSTEVPSSSTEVPSSSTEVPSSSAEVPISTAEVLSSSKEVPLGSIPSSTEVLSSSTKAPSSDAKNFSSLTVELSNSAVKPPGSNVEEISSSGITLDLADSDAAGNRMRRSVGLKISCNGIKAMGPSAALILQAEHLKEFSAEELEDCLEAFGGLELSHDFYMKIWERVNRTVLLSQLTSLGRLVQAIQLGDIRTLDLNLSSDAALDVLSVLGRHVHNARLLEVLAAQLTAHNPALTYAGSAHVVALGRVACELSLPTLRKMVGTDFVRVARSLGRMDGCPMGCVDKMLRMAKEETAFGGVEKWDEGDLETLGVIPSGLLAQEWQAMDASVFPGLTAKAVRCIPPLAFKEFSSEQISQLSLTAAASVTPQQIALLSPDRNNSLFQVRNMEPVWMVNTFRSTGFNVDHGGDDKVSSAASAIPLALISLATFALRALLS